MAEGNPSPDEQDKYDPTLGPRSRPKVPSAERMTADWKPPRAEVILTSNQRYRKRPVVIDAWRNLLSSIPPEWLQGRGSGHAGSNIQIVTLEGVMTANPGDWIIKGVKDEIYPCKHDIFLATYESADSPSAPETKPDYWMDRLWEIHKIATQSRVLPEDVDRIAQLSLGFAQAPPLPSSQKASGDDYGCTGCRSTPCICSQLTENGPGEQP